MGRDNGAPMMDDLKPQPGQSGSYQPKFHPLPGAWAREQIDNPRPYREDTGRSSTKSMNEIDSALAAERRQHEYWEEWQGIRPGKAIYENPRELQNTLLPSAKYGVEGRGYG